MTRQQADALVAELRAVSADAKGLAVEFSATELGRAPAAGAWSAADNLMHLTIAARALELGVTRSALQPPRLDRRRTARAHR